MKVNHRSVLMCVKRANDSQRWNLVAEGKRSFARDGIPVERKPERCLHSRLPRTDRLDSLFLMLRADHNLLSLSADEQTCK